MSAALKSDLTALDALSDHEFRMEVRSWVETHYPPDLRNPPSRLHFSETKVWYHLLSDKGWLAPGWPRQHGGMGLPAARLASEAHGDSQPEGDGSSLEGRALQRRVTFRYQRVAER